MFEFEYICLFSCFIVIGCFCLVLYVGVYRFGVVSFVLIIIDCVYLIVFGIGGCLVPVYGCSVIVVVSFPVADFVLLL